MSASRVGNFDLPRADMRMFTSRAKRSQTLPIGSMSLKSGADKHRTLLRVLKCSFRRPPLKEFL